MKDIIVLCAVLPFTLAIICLIGYTQHNSQEDSFVQETVYQAAQQASLDGCFNLTNTENIKEQISKELSVDKDEIKITADATVKYRPEAISYKVVVPIKKVVPANRLFGISDEQNVGKILVESKIMSQRLTP